MFLINLWWLWVPALLLFALVDTLRGPVPKAPRVGGLAGYQACNAAFDAKHEAANPIKRGWMRNPCGARIEWTR